MPELASNDASVPANGPSPERLGRIIADQAATLRYLKTTNLAVVIKPDSRLELRLDLCQDGAQVAVQAHCESANLPLYQAHWEQLQRLLAAQGVLLAPLSAPGHSPAQPGVSARGA